MSPICSRIFAGARRSKCPRRSLVPLPSPPLVLVDIHCLWQAPKREFYMNLRRIPKCTQISGSCLGSGWMDGWLDDWLTPSQRAGLYIHSVSVCVCVLQMDNKTFLSTLFPTLKSHVRVLCPSRHTLAVCKVPKHFYLLFFYSICIFFFLFFHHLVEFSSCRLPFQLVALSFLFLGFLSNSFFSDVKRDFGQTNGICSLRLCFLALFPLSI